ncbi:MAG: hypothetical protein KBS52_06730 [Clostridiales bacterium]|nr:hypothetical protein [Candidatus Equinaster intestinalis]
MEKAIIETTKFSDSDVIATSLHIDIIKIADSEIPAIWLDKASVLNYNAYSDKDMDLFMQGDSEYYAYVGKINDAENYDYALRKDKSEKPANVNVMTAGNEKTYQMIYDWLSDHKHY